MMMMPMTTISTAKTDNNKRNKKNQRNPAPQRRRQRETFGRGEAGHEKSLGRLIFVISLFIDSFPSLCALSLSHHFLRRVSFRSRRISHSDRPAITVIMAFMNGMLWFFPFHSQNCFFDVWSVYKPIFVQYPQQKNKEK